MGLGGRGQSNWQGTAGVVRGREWEVGGVKGRVWVRWGQEKMEWVLYRPYRRWEGG